MDSFGSKSIGSAVSQYGLQAATAQFGALVYNKLKDKHQGLKNGGKTKTATATATVTTSKKRKLSLSDMPQEHQRFRYKRGRKPKKNLKQAWKLLKSTTEPIYLRAQAMNVYSTPDCGFMKLFSIKNTKSPEQERTYLPCHIYDVSAFMNNVGGSLTFGDIGPYTPSVSNTSSFLRYPIVRRLLDAAGAERDQWGVESTAHLSTAVAQAPHRRSLWDWFDFRLLCYGRTTVSTRWRIQLVQFSEENLHPRELADNQMDGETIPRSIEFWNSYLSPMMNNPIDSANVEARKGCMKVLKSIDFLQASSRTDDGTASNIPLIQEIRGFHRMNRMQSYDWDYSKREATYDTFGQVNKYVVNDANCEPYVTARARIYLVISAQSQCFNISRVTPPISTIGLPLADPANGGGTPNAGGDFDVTAVPSYDILLRVRHTLDD